MKQFTKRILLPIAFLFIFSFASFASHIVGGDLTVRWTGVGNNFEITLQFFRDCNTVPAVPFDATIQVGLFDKSTNQLLQTINTPTFSITKVKLGDNCYTPTTCIEKAVYKTIIPIAGNANGLYLSYHRCCRNATITNIINPASSGYVMYCEIPNPNMHNSTPTFDTLPDGFMCHKYINTDDFSCTDPDGDQLVYSFSTPLDCAPTGICGPDRVPPIPNGTWGSTSPGAWPKPYGTITWGAGYSLANQMGDAAMTVNPTTGIVTTTPPNNGTYVFCVKVEEYRAGVKIGEIRRDFQFQMLPCQTLNVTHQPSSSICLGTTKTLSANSISPGDFTYKWSPGGQTTTSISVTPTTNGTYNYTVTATKGACAYTATTTITVNANPSTSAVTPSNILCRGGVGSATVTGSGGTSPYTYQWLTAPVQTTTTATGLTPGTYTVTVTDANKCSSSKTVSITQPSASLTATTSATNAGCNLAIGTASVSASGGTPGYSYSWNSTPVQTTRTATGLLSGNYTVTTKDANGCTRAATIYIPVANGPSVTATVVSDVLCYGTNTGSASTSSTTGGTKPYTYAWSPTGQTTANATGLYASITYTVLVTDALNCSSFSTVDVEEPPLLSSSGISSTNVSCYLGSNGTSTVTPTGGTAPYSYVWSTLPAQTDQVAVGLSSGTLYTVTVTDANKCTSSNTVTLSQPTALVTSITSTTMPACFGYNNGNATVSASGGTLGSGYTFSWSTSPVQTTATVTGLSAGDYTATVTDAQGCVTTQTVSISEPTAVTLTTFVSGFSCAGTSPNGVATATAGGGTPGYSYLWKPGNKTTPSISNLTEGTYSVTITDSKGCSISETATIVASVKPDALFSAEPVISCEGVMMKFTDESTPAPIDSWSWNFGDGQTSTDQHPSHAYSYDAGIYSVTLIVSSPPCKDTIKTNIKISDMFDYASFERANIFTPNGDGFNDCFTPALIGNGADTLIDCVSLVVFDRWGIKMFESVGTNNCWPGNDKTDNKPAVDGVYFYISRLGKTTIKGYVTLVRNKPE